jgi:TPR repeat protein
MTHRLVTLLAVVTALGAFAAASLADPATDHEAAHGAYRRGDFPEARRLWLEGAVRDDIEAQHRLALMLYYGEGGPRDVGAAHRWLHIGAENGHPQARTNLALLHAVTGFPRDPALDEPPPTALDELEMTLPGDAQDATAAGRQSLIGLDALGDPLGREVFHRFCAGCHGFDGIAFYPPAPSFAFGDRLFKSEGALLQSVLEGRGAMPSWEDKLPEEMLRRAVRYLRSLAIRSVAARGPVGDPRPEWFYHFKPFGEHDMPTWAYDR